MAELRGEPTFEAALWRLSLLAGFGLLGVGLGVLLGGATRRFLDRGGQEV